MKKILITGGYGMIGRELTELLDSNDVDILIADKPKCDLIDYDVCLQACKDKDEVYHLAGIKGNPKMTMERPADFMRMIQFDSNMIFAAQECGVKKFLYTSSIAVEFPEEDKYPSWAKKTAEMLIDAMRIQYPNGTKYCIVRPANVFGKYDNFDNPDAMVITSLISKAMQPKPSFEVWGDGNQTRDFINAKDVARLMIKIIEHMPQEPINACSGIPIKIRDIADFIGALAGKKIAYNKEKQIGSQSRIMEPNYKFNKKVGFTIEPGAILKQIKEIMMWKMKQK